MARRFDSPALVIASHNTGKVREMRDLLAPYGINVASAGGAGGMGLPEPVEDGDSFAANAEIKARAIAAGSGLPALADDSGLVVDALGGAPGIYSARWAGPDKDFARAMERVEAGLTGQKDRGAAFVCVLALAWPDGGLECFEGRIGGTIVSPPRGARGFGYDPIFLPEGGFETFGEMAPRAKHAISHRARAFRKLVAGCFDRAGPADSPD